MFDRRGVCREVCTGSHLAATWADRVVVDCDFDLTVFANEDLHADYQGEAENQRLPANVEVHRAAMCDVGCRVREAAAPVQRIVILPAVRSTIAARA